MGKVILDMSMSLDGFVAPPPGQPERLHDWMFPPDGSPVPAASLAVIKELEQSLGAIIMGRHSFDAGDQADGFVDNPYDAAHIVVTHRVPEKLPKGNTSFTFVTDGIESALEKAKAAAGNRDIAIGGGASLARQYIQAGLLDEIELHIIPALLGSGLRLFDETVTRQNELEILRVIETPTVTHLRYRFAK